MNDKTFNNIPPALTSMHIRKHFLHCEECPTNNMAQKPIPIEASGRAIVHGEEFQIDIKVFTNNPKAQKHKRAFRRYTGALTAIDLSTRYKIGTLIRSHTNQEVHFEALRVQIHGSGYMIKVLRLDNEYMAQDMKTWAASASRPYSCIPASHMNTTRMATSRSSTSHGARPCEAAVDR